MTKSIRRFMVTLVLASLMVMSCAPGATTAPTTGPTTAPATTSIPSTTAPVSKQDTVKLTLKKLDGTTVVRDVRKPQYGGTLHLLEQLPTTSFDPFLTPQFVNGYRYFTNEAFFYGDWTRGPAGTNETDWLTGFGGNMQLLSGAVAESWDTPDHQTIIWHIRHGVHWWNKPPTNGRELTADDVVWYASRYFAMPKSYFYSYTAQKNNPTSIKALDKYTVEMKFPAGVALASILIDMGGNMPAYPPDVTLTYGDNMKWEHLTGTGPFMVVDVVANSTMTLLRNPNYWQSDPMFPQNKLPYPDKLITYQITDASTRQAAFRTGKIDLLYGNVYEDFVTLQKQNPDLGYVKTIGATYIYVLSGRMDKADQPFKDVRVRRALNMAVNKQAMLDGYYAGQGQLLAFPVPDGPAFPYYVPLEKQPKSVQELFEYNPQKAKQLLAEAGYPNGFKTTVAVNAVGDGPDIMAIIREDLLKVGVDMQIKPVESGVFSSLFNGRTHDQMIFAQTDPANAYLLLPQRADQHWNTSFWSHPRVDQAVSQISEHLLTGNSAAMFDVLRDVNTLIIDEAWGVWLPQPYRYNLWWPWLANNYGVFNTGYNAQSRHFAYVWMDQALKESMGY